MGTEMTTRGDISADAARSGGRRASSRLPRFCRLMTTMAAVVMLTLAVTVTPASAQTATVGGCSYNCAGDYRLSDPAEFWGVDVRADLGAISLNIWRGHRGYVRVQAWVWSWSAGRYVASFDQWVPDKYTTEYYGTQGSDMVTMYPGTKGAHSVYVRLSYSDGTTPFNGWAQQHRHWYYTSGGWAWWSSSHAYL